MTKVSEFQQTGLAMVRERGIISSKEFFEALVDLNPKWKGHKQKTFAGNINNTSRHNEKDRLGERAESPYNKMRKTEYNVKGHRDRQAICHIEFDDKISTDAEFRNRTYNFTPDEWKEKDRKKNEFTDKKVDEDVEEDEADEEGDEDVLIPKEKIRKEKILVLMEELGIDDDEITFQGEGWE